MTDVNKVHSVQTIGLVAEALDKTEYEIADLALGMDPGDGPVWVYSPEHEGRIIAFTNYGIENYETLIANQKKLPRHQFPAAFTVWLPLNR